MRAFQLAMIQMDVKGGDLDGNLSKAKEMIRQAAPQGADVAFLPECMDLGWTFPRAREMATAIPDGEVYRALCASAKEHGIHVCSGLTERDGDKVYNAAVLIDDRGEVLCRHRKLNELEIAHHVYDQGDRLSVVETRWGKIGVMICADGAANGQVISRSLAYMDADVILSPSSWAVKADHDHATEPYGDWWRQSYQPVGKAFSMPIVGVSNVGWVQGGPWDGWKCIGCSLAIDAEGKELHQGTYGEAAEELHLLEITFPADKGRGPLRSSE